MAGNLAGADHRGDYAGAGPAGAEPLRALFAAVCTPMATETTAGAFYRGWRLVAVDGTTFDVPDSVANVGYFGRPGSPRGEGAGAFPQVRVAGLGECGTHAIFAAEMGRWRCMRPSWPGGCWVTCAPGCC